jgi:hypothetical protein
MSVVPADIVARIQYFEAHDAPWSDHAAQIGVSAIEVAAMAARTAAARAALEEQLAAQSAAMAATLRLRLAMADMSQAGSDIIKKIRATAATDGDQVYSLAMIPAPARPSPLPPPGTPTGFTFTLNPVGTLTLKWRCRNPRGAQGTIYQVSRQVEGSGAFTFIGVSGIRRFVDETLPSGAASVIYEIVAIRSTTRGVAGRFIVNFGVGGGEGAVVAPKLAA